MAITGGMAYIVLFAVFQSIWLVTNCHQKTGRTGIVRISRADADWPAVTEEKVTLLPMKKPSKRASFMKWVKTCDSLNKFDSFQMKEPLKAEIDALTHDQLQPQFADLIQKWIYKDIPKEHSKWIVIPFGALLYSKKAHYFGAAHIDFLRHADIATLVQKYGRWSLEIMAFLAKNDHVRTSALAHYNGNVEQYAMEMLTLDYTMNIWIPTEPVQAWPLAFTTGHQCDETRTMTPSPDMDDPHKYLLQSESTSNDWYTRWNMQTDEVYVWDSRTVAHTAVKRGDGTGERSAISCVLMIVHQNEELLPPITSPPADFLCYTERVLKIMTKSHGSTAESLLAYMGYHRLCDDPPTAQPPSLSNSRLREFVLSKIVGKG
uniref:TauD/TfdA-like domain-containing protein n=1 Tax=Spongospora subterranea TaxID=70186 RepID=A0A0H5QZR3_9EUKA|eukprot:CRZ07390.1 hypothetical protein [Spongospora subterranea]